ncbi:peptidase, partial [Pandoraea nosoerga]|nr:peptidase [Pandoraea nosoerga]
VLHRYLGVAVGLVMTVWCLSGFVMMYSGYPRLTEAERLRGLAPLRFDGCCAALPTLAAPPRDFRVEMLAGRPVLRLDGVGGRTVVDLRAGTPVTGVSAPEAQAVAEAFVRGQGVAAAAGPPRLIDQD